MFKYGTRTLLGATALLAALFASHRFATTPVSFDQLAFPSEPDAHPLNLVNPPAEVRALNSRIVTIYGFMDPQSVYARNAISEFVLIRDNQEQPSTGRRFDKMIKVTMTDDQTTTFTDRPVQVTGRLRLTDQLRGLGGRIVAAYELRATRVAQ